MGFNVNSISCTGINLFLAGMPRHHHSVHLEIHPFFLALPGNDHDGGRDFSVLEGREDQRSCFWKYIRSLFCVTLELGSVYLRTNHEENSLVF